MTRTGISPRLGQHLPEPFVEIHPDDAARFGVTDGGFARVITDYGQCILKVVVSERQQRGMLFAPIHWSEETASCRARRRAGGAVHRSRFPASPRTRRPRCRSRLTNTSFAASPCRGRRSQLPPQLWWARVAVAGGYGYLLADNADLARWQSGCARSPATISPNTGISAAAFIARHRSPDDRIETCLFVGPAHDAGDWDVVKSLFAADALSDDQRRMLLSGQSTDGLASAGPIVCACFGVGRNTICDAIAAGARSPPRSARN